MQGAASARWRRLVAEHHQGQGPAAVTSDREFTGITNRRSGLWRGTSGASGRFVSQAPILSRRSCPTTSFLSAPTSVPGASSWGIRAFLYVQSCSFAISNFPLLPFSAPILLTGEECLDSWWVSLFVLSLISCHELWCCNVRSMIT